MQRPEFVAHRRSLEFISSFEFRISDFSFHHVLNSSDQDLAAVSDGGGDNPRFEGGFAGDLARGIRGDHGAVGLGEIDVDEFDWLPGYADCGGI